MDRPDGLRRRRGRVPGRGRPAAWRRVAGRAHADLPGGQRAGPRLPDLLGQRHRGARRPGSRPGRVGPAAGLIIENEAFLVEADPDRGGTLSRILDKRSGRELATGPANELVLQEEYDYHPKWNEGPWLLTPKGPGTGSAGRPARVRAERCAIGARLVAETDLRRAAFYRRRRCCGTAPAGSSSAPTRTARSAATGCCGSASRPRSPARLPVYQSALSVVGRPFGSTDTDVAEHWYTLDNPAHEWFGLSSAARVSLTAPSGERLTRAIGVAEVVCPVRPDAVQGGDPAPCWWRWPARASPRPARGRTAPIRLDRPGLEPARRPHRTRRPGAEPVHRRGARRGRPGAGRELAAQLSARGCGPALGAGGGQPGAGIPARS